MTTSTNDAGRTKQLSRTLRNPKVQDVVTIITSGNETNGEYGVLEVEVQPGGGTPLHYHTSFTEHFEPVIGTLSVQAGKEAKQLRPGESFTVPLNVVHRFFNETDKAIVFRCTVRPARNFEKALRIGYGLAEDGKVNKAGIPKNLWHIAIVFTLSESYLYGIPLWFQRATFGLLAWIGKRIGADRDFAKYYAEA